MTDLDVAKEKLKLYDMTCVLCRGETVLTSDKSGIAPMMRYIEQKTNLNGFSAADKIIGKAAAMLFALAGICEVYGEVMSRSALPVLEEHGIRYYYGTLTDAIFNRNGNGICPMEQTVMQISKPEKAFEALKQKMQQLSGGIKA